MTIPFHKHHNMPAFLDILQVLIRVLLKCAPLLSFGLEPGPALAHPRQLYASLLPFEALKDNPRHAPPRCDALTFVVCLPTLHHLSPSLSAYRSAPGLLAIFAMHCVEEHRQASRQEGLRIVQSHKAADDSAAALRS